VVIATKRLIRLDMCNRGLLIFDLDGTLFRAETVTIPAVQQGFLAQGLAAPAKEEISFYFGKPASQYHAWLSSRCPQEKASELIETIDRRELELISEMGELYPQAQEVLATLRGWVGQMALYSNGPQDYVERVMTVHGLGPFFDAVRYWHSTLDSKSSMVRELVERLESRPVIIIGDRGDDIQAAHENGLGVIAAQYGYGTAEELEAADAAAVSLLDLPHLVCTLLGKTQGAVGEPACALPTGAQPA
jgi:phosphoglycolate phosphatase